MLELVSLLLVVVLLGAVVAMGMALYVLYLIARSISKDG
jgi:hypothetical protein